MPKTDPDTCKHPMTSVMSAWTFTAKGQEFTEQRLACVDCGTVCETNIF